MNIPPPTDYRESCGGRGGGQSWTYCVNNWEQWLLAERTSSAGSPDNKLASKQRGIGETARPFMYRENSFPAAHGGVHCLFKDIIANTRTPRRKHTHSLTATKDNWVA